MKQRLVGAIVLVALAVIFLPMVFNGAEDSGPVAVAIEIPEQPAAPANRLDGAAGAERASSEPELDPASSSVAGATAEPADDSAAPNAETKTSAGVSGKADSRTEPASANAAETEAGPDAAAMAWLIQVGSFVRETNALVLRDRLRQSGYEAFANHAQADGVSVWRVRIGPVATRAEAEALGRRVEAERGGAVLVISQP